MPKRTDPMTEGTLVTWEKNVGDNIARGTVVATVETDKAIMDVEVFREGHLSGPLAPVGAVVPVGGAIAYPGAEAKDVKRGEGPAVKTAAPAPAAVPAPGKIGPSGTPQAQ